MKEQAQYLKEQIAFFKVGEKWEVWSEKVWEVRSDFQANVF
jgi:hypothetical protein